MVGTKARNRSLPINGLNNGAQQVNGFYVHSSPPKALQVNPRAIRQWIRLGDISQLEQLVLDGQGHKLIGEFSSDPKVRNFIKQVPLYMAKIRELHNAVTKGDLKQLQKVLEFKSSDMKNIAMSKNHAGVGLLHKAVYNGYLEIVEFLVSNYPQMLNVKDKEGRTPLHYSGGSNIGGRIWSTLTRAGADAKILDSRNKLPVYYMENSDEIQIPEDKMMPQVSTNSAPPDLVIKPSNIRIWIHDRDLGKLQQVIWEGHGGKLRVETSNNPRVRRFLEGVPHILNVIKDIHYAVVYDNLEDFEKKSSDPVPVEILGSKDVNGLNPLHKASGLGHQKIAQAILQRNPNLVGSVDHEGRTPLHYAATLRDNNAIYNFLVANRADEMVFDKNGKMASYYKSNSKELNRKVLEVIPEAPRTAQQFPQTWDWMLFYPTDSAPSTLASLKSDVPQTNEIEPSKKINLEQIEKTKSPVKHPYHKPQEKENMKPKEEEEGEKIEQLEFNEKPTENVEGPKEESKFEEKKEAIQVGESKLDDEPSEDYDIWTNESANRGDDDKEDKGSTEDEGYPKEEDSGTKDQIESDSERQSEEVFHDSRTPENQSVESLNDSGLHESSDNREKTEREIAEERQRLLDEGLVKINSESSDVNEEDTVNEIIESGDMEKLASMVLNGEGDKLLGKTTKNEEIQTFLDNLPTYMSKITAVHRAAKSGSLKELHGALDRRRFAIAKESSDSLGATPLHVALLFQNAQIVKYLAGRFPETLNVKDKYGRTPLHYAAVIPENNYFYDTLLDSGADQNIRDDDDHPPEYYKENPGQLTLEKLIKEFNQRDVSSALTDPSVYNIEPQISFDEGIPLSKTAGSEDKDEGNGRDSPLSNFSTTDRDEYGQSIIHFASARAHGRGGLFQLIQDSGVNLGYRDELYRTPRDIALQANMPENADEIDRFVISLAARGEKEKLIQLFLEGYDHILDMEDDKDNNIVTVAENENNEKTVTFLKAIPILEEKRESVHRAIRAGAEKLVQDIITDSKNARLIVIGKNSTGRCSLHISVLCQQKEITEFIAQKFPETLKIGDNLERTALHYAMGVEEVETLSKILIQCGAKRVVKDLKGRQPTYYFMNRTEILKLQEEENILKV